MHRKAWLLVTALATGGALAACGGDDGSSTTGTGTTTTTGGGGTGGGSEAECGDGLIGGEEACDDGGMADGDGCDADCAVEPGFTCDGAPSACAAVCGDGMLAGAEACDDANTAPGDGCGDACALEAGYACSGEPSACATVCGDGIIAGAEACDDGNAALNDGCSDACALEAGFDCTGEPTACTAICGDGLVVGPEGCDDAGTAAGDGCNDVCALETGYACTGAPSNCYTVCGDGLLVGGEGCDDGNTMNGDGCNANCTPSTGESCLDPLVMSQATESNGVYTWVVPAGSVTASDATFDCDPNTIGSDVVIQYTKTSDTLANGGMLLHVKADPATTNTAQYLNLMVVGGACSPAQGTQLKCLWYKHDWDSFLDVPAGTYYIWVAKNSPDSSTVLFPETTVTVEELPAASAEGEGCFAPYTSASANYTPPAMPGDPHTWTIPPTINSFDMAPTWGEPGSMSCDNHTTYGDITGVDAVIAFDKTSATSVLKVDVQNLDPTLSASDLDVEVLSVCDPMSPAKISRNCRADKDTVSLTAPSPAGPVYVWVSTEATSEELNGAQVQVTEIFPGPGESWPTAEPLLGSGAINPTSTMRLDPPSCLPGSGNVHWYQYTLINDVLALTTNAAGAIGIYDAGGQQITCVTDASSSPLIVRGAPGEQVYIAVPSAGPITSLSYLDVVYDGVKGDLVDMEIQFPTSPVTEYGMAVSATEIFLGGTSLLFSIPKAMGATATLQSGSLATTNLGYDLEFAGGALFSVDETTTTSSSRLYRVYDGTSWGAVTWDLAPAYQASSPFYAITYDGQNLLLATRRTSASTSFYSLSPAAPGGATLLGTNNNVWYGTGLAADNAYFYVTGNGSAGEGVYRISRAAISNPAVRIAAIDTSTTSHSTELSSYVAPGYLYVRAYGGDIHAIIDPGGNAIHYGAIATMGGTADYAMAYDQAEAAIYFFSTEKLSTGQVLRME